MSSKLKNLLVTGGCGFIGSNFIKNFLENNDQVNIYNLDNLTYAGSIKNTSEFSFHKKYKFIKGDICDSQLLKEIFNKYSIDGVINFAAESHVDNSIINPKVFVETNVTGVFNLLNIAYTSWMNSPHNKKPKYEHSRFHQISTDEVYGSIRNGSFNENDRHNPSSPYSASKSAADMIVMSYYKTYGLNTTISYSSNNFGPNQHKEKFIPKVVEILRNDGQIPLYGDGNNIRDWIPVIDNCKAIELIFFNGKSGESYNIGGNNEFSNISIIKLISEILKIEPNIKFVKDRYAHDYRYSLNIDKIKKELNWEPESNFTSQMSKYIKNIT